MIGGLRINAVTGEASLLLKSTWLIFVEYFEFIRREFVPPEHASTRENRARDTLKKLSGD